MITETQIQTILWPGESGLKYKYSIHSIEANFPEKAGNYIFAKETSPGSWKPIYIGQTKNLNERLENHEKEACAKRSGATHIHAHLNPNQSDRLSEETDLIRHWNPVCNG